MGNGSSFSSWESLMTVIDAYLFGWSRFMTWQRE